MERGQLKGGYNKPVFARRSATRVLLGYGTGLEGLHEAVARLVSAAFGHELEPGMASRDGLAELGHPSRLGPDRRLPLFGSTSDNWTSMSPDTTYFCLFDGQGTIQFNPAANSTPRGPSPLSWPATCGTMRPRPRRT